MIEEPPPPDDESRLRVPPHSREAEQSVLGALLLDNTAYARVQDKLGDADFYRHEHRTIFEAITGLIDAGALADVITVFQRLQEIGKAQDCGGLAYLNALAQSVPSAAGIVTYATLVRERSVLRRMIAMADEIATDAFNPKGRTVEQLMDEAEGRVASLFRAQNRKLPGTKVPLLTIAQLQETALAVRWLIKHVVPADSMGMIYGASGTFKSFIALDAALHIAHGLPWLGRRTTQGAVIYIAAEGGSGLWSRISAWHRTRNLSTSDLPFHVVPAALDLKADAWRLVETAQAVGVTPALVIVDTLSQTFSGEENSATEMSAYLRELGARFRSLWGCSVCLIHHSGHNATERPRGSSALRANLDYMLGVFRDEKEMLATLTCEKQKDGDRFEDATFSLTVHTLGTDEDGDRVTSLVARHLSSADEIDAAVAAEAKAGRVGKNQLLLTLVQPGMTAKELQKAFYEDCGLAEEEARRKAYYRAKKWAIDAGFIEIAEGRVITLKAAR